MVMVRVDNKHHTSLPKQLLHLTSLLLVDQVFISHPILYYKTHQKKPPPPPLPPPGNVKIFHYMHCWISTQNSQVKTRIVRDQLYKPKHMPGLPGDIG